MTPADPDGLAFLPPRDPPTGQRYRLSLAKVREELERYLPSAQAEAANRLATFVKDGAPENRVESARAELVYLEHDRGPGYQVELLKQLGQRDVDAVITAQQTPLERVREIGAALATRIKSQQPVLVQRAVRALEQAAHASENPLADKKMGQPAPATPATPAQDKNRSR